MGDKRLTILALAATLTLTLAACNTTEPGAEATVPSNTNTPITAMSTPTPTPTGVAMPTSETDAITAAGEAARAYFKVFDEVLMAGGEGGDTAFKSVATGTELTEVEKMAATYLEKGAKQTAPGSIEIQPGGIVTSVETPEGEISYGQVTLTVCNDRTQATGIYADGSPFIMSEQLRGLLDFTVVFDPTAGVWKVNTIDTLNSGGAPC